MLCICHWCFVYIIMLHLSVLKWDSMVFRMLIFWRRHMETFSTLMALCEGIHETQVDHPTRTSNAGLWWVFIVWQYKLLNKQSRCGWFGNSWCSRGVIVIQIIYIYIYIYAHTMVSTTKRWEGKTLSQFLVYSSSWLLINRLISIWMKMQWLWSPFISIVYLR